MTTDGRKVGIAVAPTVRLASSSYAAKPVATTRR